jgi:hypothetical protein
MQKTGGGPVSEKAVLVTYLNFGGGNNFYFALFESET